MEYRGSAGRLLCVPRNASSTLRTTDWSLTKDTYDAEHVDLIAAGMIG
jgi:hypothetical protein